MEENNLPQMRRVIGLPQKREEVTAILSECYTRDLLNLEEYENRMELVHAAGDLDELEHLISDVPEDVMAFARNTLPDRQSTDEGNIRVNSGMQRLADRRLAVRVLNLEVTSSMVQLRFNEVPDLPSDILITVEVDGSMVRILVPPEYEVVEELENSASMVSCRRGRRWRDIPVTGRITIRGNVRSSVVAIRTKRRKIR